MGERRRGARIKASKRGRRRDREGKLKVGDGERKKQNKIHTSSSAVLCSHSPPTYTHTHNIFIVPPIK